MSQDYQKFVSKGWRAVLWKDTTPIGWATSVSVSIEENLESFFELGDRMAVSIVEGNCELSGTIERAWIDNSLLNLLGKSTGLDQFNLTIFKIQASGYPILYLYYCKVASGSIDVPQDGFLTKSVDFQARRHYFALQTV